ncbi:hypothetical protein BDV59DRAFT_137544 [Aspergillus ambiguus]|uniref:uncharacterized protein n=1 Tax=Aspergillus ambiguus TaxID=176160 RepID=UPI003CCCE7A8
MYDTAPPLDLEYIKQQHLPRRYDSEEEEVSESELGGQENAFSPVESYKAPGTFDSDTSADELSNADDVLDLDAEKDAQFARLLPPYSSTGLGSRPVSMDTVKRSSGTTFVADSYIFDHDDDVIIELPSPDTTSPMQSPTLLQPTVYIPPESPVSMRPSSRSSSPTSMLSDDDTDVLVAEQVTFVKPRPKPNLILISPSPEQSAFPFKSASAVQTTFRENEMSRADSPDLENLYSLKRAAKSQPALGDSKREAKKKNNAEKRGSLQLCLRGHDGQPIGPAASNPLASLAEVPEQTRPVSVRSQSVSFSRPKTAFSEKGSSSRSRPPTSGIRRPPSLQSLSSVFHSRHASVPYSDDSHNRSMPYSHSNASSEYSMSSPSTSRHPSPAPSPTTYYSSPNYTRDRSGSAYSSSSMSARQANRTPLPIRNSIMKSSTASSLYSSSSLRSEVESIRSLDQSDAEQPKGHSRRKKSMRSNKLTKADGEQSTAKSFMGFMFRGKRRSTINTLNA